MMHQELTYSLIILEAWGEMQQQTEGEQYVTITRADLSFEKVCMLLTNVEIDTVPGKPDICTSESLPSKGYFGFHSLSRLSTIITA